ncbi:MAG: hypothetical protein KC910_11360 [Candidatus Eremiobacteraeota bacterium]|nr:hypothetical protein [Candidatus Eremiobacteraeota bacterium]
MVKYLMLALALVAPCWADTVEVLGFGFETPLELSQPEELSSSTRSFGFPADKPYKEAEFELVVHLISAQQIKAMEGIDPVEVAITNFLGITSKPIEINKALFLGKTAADQVYETNIPRKCRVHVLSGALPDGGRVMLAFRVFDGQHFGDFFRVVKTSFAPLPKE